MHVREWPAVPPQDGIQTTEIVRPEGCVWQGAEVAAAGTNIVAVNSARDRVVGVVVVGVIRTIDL